MFPAAITAFVGSLVTLARDAQPLLQLRELLYLPIKLN
jgi:hypothetical protein